MKATITTFDDHGKVLMISLDQKVRKSHSLHEALSHYPAVTVYLNGGGKVRYERVD